MGWTKYHRHGMGLLFGLIFTALVAACSLDRYGEVPQMPSGDVEQGRQAIVNYGCGACHVIPGVDGAVGTVGAPLTGWARRHYIAGNLPNTPTNLIRWLRDPQGVEPGTAMPNLGVSETEARNIGAYLYTLTDIR